MPYPAKKMEETILQMLREPGTGRKLREEAEDGRRILRSDDGAYGVDRGIVRFLGEDSLAGNNKSYQKLYDRLAPLYDAITGLYAGLKNGGEKSRVMQYLSGLTVPDGAAVVEISVGTGRNLRYLNPNARYFGVDISFGMLRRCENKMRRLNRKAVLLQAEAENLPLRDDSFDVVFSAGGFNFFSDRNRAVAEMLRIAKSGSLLMISDETEAVRRRYEHSRVAGKFYDQPHVAMPAEFVPPECKEVRYREICGGELYVLTFRKP